jgi:hypothetical protein
MYIWRGEKIRLIRQPIHTPFSTLELEHVAARWVLVVKYELEAPALHHQCFRIQL